MELTHEEVGLFSPWKREVRELYERAFPDVERLRAFRVGAPNVPVVVSSGSSEDEIREMFGSRSYDTFLAKPYTLAELKRAVSPTTSPAGPTSAS